MGGQSTDQHVVLQDLTPFMFTRKSREGIQFEEDEPWTDSPPISMSYCKTPYICPPSIS